MRAVSPGRGRAFCSVAHAGRPNPDPYPNPNPTPNPGRLDYEDLANLPDLRQAVTLRAPYVETRACMPGKRGPCG